MGEGLTMAPSDPVLEARYRSLARRPPVPAGDRILVVDVERQRLGLLEGGRLLAEYPVSTSSRGLGTEDGSFRTPPGWHRIHARVGEGADPGTVFRSRVPSGEIWRGEPTEEDLILARVLTLEGLEEGFNRGPGVDSLERTIYIHGTSQPGLLGRPASHGCVRLGTGDVIDLFGRCREGDPVLVAPGPMGRLHFAGVGGSGMSALAQFAAARGIPVSGSDRSFDRGGNPAGRALLEAAGVRILPQDGSGVDGDCAGVVHSTAVEDQVPDIREARAHGVPLLHRSELLAFFVAEHRTLAITGTSGKSTAVAMAFEILRGAGRDPSVITGGDLRALKGEGLWGNAWTGGSDLLVIEADESDGSLVRYAPAVGVVMNLQKDHKEMDVVAGMFRTFRERSRAFCVGDAPNLAEFREGSTVFGGTEEAGLRCREVAGTPGGSTFTLRGVRFEVPVPGFHNVENALAAIAGCLALGVPLEAMAGPLAAFQGVARRFETLGRARGVEVVDDFGHNPAKVAATLATARDRSRRTLAVFQPHGFGPLRFLRREFAQAFTEGLRPGDLLLLLPVFFAGGTVSRDVDSADLAGDIRALGASAEAVASREALVEAILAQAREGDLVVVMGARDPSLTDLAKGILARLGA
jgi:UDP-N-acetylmuramate--alanine ligase